MLEPAIADPTADRARLRVVLVFDGGFDGMDAGAMWQDLRTCVRECQAWERIALVTGERWMTEGLRLFAWAMLGEARAFLAAERADAVAWASGAKPEPLARPARPIASLVDLIVGAHPRRDVEGAVGDRV